MWGLGCLVWEAFNATTLTDTSNLKDTRKVSSSHQFHVIHSCQLLGCSIFFSKPSFNFLFKFFLDVEQIHLCILSFFFFLSLSQLLSEPNLNYLRGCPSLT